MAKANIPPADEPIKLFIYILIV